jgi:N4-gp56 family major capsid protein
MASTAYGTNHGLTVKAWAKKLWIEALKETRYAQFKGSDSQDSLISLKSEVSKEAGDRVTQGLRMQLTGAGVAGDGTLEGNEEALVTYNDAVVIDQLRHAVRSSGKMSEQRVTFDHRQEAKAGLRDWWSDRLDTWLFNQLAGATTQQTQANGTSSASVDTRYSGMNAALAPDTGHIFSSSNDVDNTTEASLSLTTTFALKYADLDRAVARAKTGNNGTAPVVRPLKVNGDDMFVLFIHPFSTTQLRKNTATGNFQDIQKATLQGGRINDNPIITGLLGTYNKVMMVEDQRVPLVSTAVTSSASYRRNVFCGAQAAIMAVGQNHSDAKMTWHEETFDHGNQLAVSSALIAGLKKAQFPINGTATDFSTIVISSFAPAQ